MDNKLSLLLLALDLDKERDEENRRFAQNPPRSLEEELAWQREVQRRADAGRIKREMSGKRASGTRDKLLKAAFAEAVRTLGQKRLELLLGKKLSARKRTFTVREARLLRKLISGVDSGDGTDLYCGGHAK